MENIENLVVETTENVEGTTTEEIVEQVTEPEKVYTEEDFNRKLDEVLGKKVARKEAKIRKEYEKKYGRLESVLKAGTGKENVEELTDTFSEYYTKKGIRIPTEPNYSDKDIAVLAQAEANDIINAGWDEVVEEVDRLADLGIANMSPREKAVFGALATYRQNNERGRALSKIGVTEDVYNSKEFKEFAGKFSANTPVTEIYDIYAKTQPKKEVRTMGSLKSGSVADTSVKDYYSYEEAMKFTKTDFDRNPELYKAVQRSMQKWK